MPELLLADITLKLREAYRRKYPSRSFSKPVGLLTTPELSARADLLLQILSSFGYIVFASVECARCEDRRSFLYDIESLDEVIYYCKSCKLLTYKIYRFENGDT